jgi:hypothetical protein
LILPDLGRDLGSLPLKLQQPVRQPSKSGQAFDIILPLPTHVSSGMLSLIRTLNNAQNSTQCIYFQMQSKKVALSVIMA